MPHPHARHGRKVRPYIFAAHVTLRVHRSSMRIAILVAAGFFALLGAACSKPEPVAAAPEPDPALERRERHFGPEIAARKDIEWRSSGLGIRIIEPGEGTPPKLTDKVRVRYIGRLKDGTVFDDSTQREKPSDFPVNQLINGWAAAMPTLKPGGKAEFYIPPHLGYGGMRAGNIPPNSGLIFEVELIAVNPQPGP